MVSKSTSYNELARAIGYTTYAGNIDTIKKRLNDFKISTDHFSGKGAHPSLNDNDIFVENSLHAQSVLRRHYMKLYAPSECSICKMKAI